VVTSLWAKMGNDGNPGNNVATVAGANSQWNNSGSLVVKAGALNIQSGGVVSNTTGHVFGFSYNTNPSSVTVTGNGSRWNNSKDFLMAWAPLGVISPEEFEHLCRGDCDSIILNIEAGGLVTVGGTATIIENSTVNLVDARFEFGQMTLASFNRINATAGSLEGIVNVSGENDKTAFASLWNPEVDMSQVVTAFDMSSATFVELGDASTASDINFPGYVYLNSTLSLMPLTSYTDRATRGTVDDFTIITAGQRGGTFNEVRYSGSVLAADFRPDANGSFRSHQGDGLFRNVTYISTAVELQNLLAVQGDTDGDRDIDTADLTRVISGFTGAAGSGATWLTGDIDGDEDVDSRDVTRAIINFTGARNAAVAVPEPAGLLLLVLAVGCLAVERSRSCRS